MEESGKAVLAREMARVRAVVVLAVAVMDLRAAIVSWHGTPLDNGMI